MQAHIYKSDHPMLDETNFRIVRDGDDQIIVTIPQQFFGEVDEFIEEAAKNGELKREYLAQVQEYFANQKFKKN